jgi:transcription-repair coupling factor (superfamily II helicase)
LSLQPVLDLLVRDEAVARLMSHVGTANVVDIACAAGARSSLTALIADGGDGRAARPVLAVTATGREAQDLAAALRGFLPAERIVEFPSWETLPHERLSPRSDTVGRRLAVLRRLAHPDTDDEAYGEISVVIASVRALMQPIAKGLGDLRPVSLRVGADAELPDVVEALAGAAYTRTDLV